MRKIPGRFLQAALLLLTFTLTIAAQDQTQQADEVVNAYVKQERFSGAVLVAKGGKVILSKGYGQANYEWQIANTPQTRFRLGSITKQFTALAIAQLEERGLLKAQDPISKYLPNYTKEIADKVTIYHLLTHTSGIPSFTNHVDYPSNIKFHNFSEEKLLVWLKDKPLEFAPGEKFKYNNSGYCMLGYIIERLSGKSYEQYLRENIFEPLGMKDTGYDHNNIIIKNRAAGYTVRNGRLENADYINMTVPGGAGALYSTVEDLYKWDRALYTEKLVKRATLDKVFTPFHSNYAWGWAVEQVNGRKRIAHSGGIEGFNTNLERFVNDDLCIIALSNRNTPVLGAMMQRLAAVAFGEKYDLPQPPAPAAKEAAGRREITVDPKIFDSYVGQYELMPEFIITVTREGDKLMVQATGQPKFEVFPESESKYFLKVVDAQIVFVKNDKGVVDKLVLHQNGGEQPAKKIR